MIISHELGDSLNRGGLILGFFAFFLATPELLGKSGLKAFGESLQAGLLQLSTTMRRTLIGGSALSLALAAYGWMVGGRQGALTIPKDDLLMLGVVGFDSAFANTMQPWPARRAAKLVENDQVRQTALYFGAVLFTLSVAMRFVATFATPATH